MAIYGGGGSTSAHRATKDKKPAKQGSSLWRILSAAGTGLLLIFLPMFHANMLMDRTIRAIFPDYEVEYRSTWPRILGGATASDIKVLAFGDDSGEEVFRFDKVTLKIPFLQYYGSMIKRWNMLGGIDDVEMVLEGGRGTMQMPLLPEAELFGNVSLSPFEAEGCLQDGAWVDDEFAGMGLPDEPLTMRLRLWREDGLALIESTLRKPGAGELRYLSKAQLKDRAALLASYYTHEDEPISDEWHLRDDGFTAARNRHCARKDGISEGEFIDRHMFTVKRLLEDVGTAPTAELEAAYRGFATRGGTFSAMVTYGDTSRMAISESSDWGDLLEYLHTGITINGEELAYSLRPVKARALPKTAGELPTFAALRREWDALRAPAATEAVDVEATSVAAKPAAAVAAVQSPPPPAAAPVVAVAAGVDDFLAPPDPEADAREGTITDYRELGKRTGERYLVHFRNKSPMRVEIVGMDGAAVRVRRNLTSGVAEHLLDRAGFVRAERVY